LVECARGFAALLKSIIIKVGNVTHPKPVKCFCGSRHQCFGHAITHKKYKPQWRTSPIAVSRIGLAARQNLGKASHQRKKRTSSTQRWYHSQGKPLRYLQHLFQSEFGNTHEGLTYVMTLYKILFQLKLAPMTENLVKDAQTVN